MTGKTSQTGRDFASNSTTQSYKYFYTGRMLGDGGAAVVWGSSIDGSGVNMYDHRIIFGNGVSDHISTPSQNIVKTIGRAVVAVDTYLTMPSRSRYYTLLTRFNIPGSVNTAFATIVLLPIRWSEFAAVAPLLATNSVLMVIIAELYVGRIPPV
ncbi:hypothetical protein F5Y03DRAFT_390170 [Xylaria venustula]|nr:hypothetical protein F5Y03DRAFT_390170 [Xylaria venustula]